jgi:hypothetical protein
MVGDVVGVKIGKGMLHPFRCDGFGGVLDRENGKTVGELIKGHGDAGLACNESVAINLHHLSLR